MWREGEGKPQQAAEPPVLLEFRRVLPSGAGERGRLLEPAAPLRADEDESSSRPGFLD